MLEAVRVVIESGNRGGGSGKVVIFTEFLTTQEYIYKLLLGSGLSPDDVTLFRGQNDSQRARAALERWETEIGRFIPPSNRPSKEVAVRLALIHEFRERSKVFVSTEAGAKGLNLQFCETLINYDLPWNPQRIEQRIGRVHRYGQKRRVTHIVFMSRDNEAQRLTFEILAQKLELFGKVLDASDTVIHLPVTDSPDPLISAFGADFEGQLRRIYEEARSLEDITEQLRVLRESMDDARKGFDEEQARAAQLIETRLDASVRQVFRRYSEDVSSALAKLDHDFDRLISGYLSAAGIPFERTEADAQILFQLNPSPLLPPGYQEGATIGVGHARDLRDAEPVHLGHPVVRAAVEEARRTSPKRFVLRLAFEKNHPQEAILSGRRGRIVVSKVSYRGIESLDHLVETAVFEGEHEALDLETTKRLLSAAPSDAAALDPPLDINDEEMEDLVQEAILADQVATTTGDNTRFDRMLEQIERYVEDQIMVLRREDAILAQRMERAVRRREVAVGAAGRGAVDSEIVSMESEQRRIQGRVEKLAARVDPDYERWRENVFTRRFRKPEVERVLELDFVVASASGDDTC